MNNYPNNNDDVYPSSYLYDDDARAKAAALHEVENYRMATVWYKEHLLKSIYNSSPVSSEAQPAQEWCDMWVDALVKGIANKNEAAFYRELEQKSFATSDLVDAFKKLEIVYKLEEVLNRKVSHETMIDEFQSMLKTHRATLVARRREGGLLDTFVRMLGVACAAILGLAVFGVGAYFAGKGAHARLFREAGTHGSQFVETVTSTSHNKK